eukprot:7309797-Prymnesium_polylepis.1
MEQLRSQMMGATAILKLKKLPEQPGKGGTIGKIVEWFAMMQTWLSEESASTRTGTDIVTDCLTFAAGALPAFAVLRDKYIGLASKTVAAITDAKREFDREMTQQACARRPSAAAPPPKRTAAAAEGRRMFRVVKSWSGSKQPPKEGVTYLAIIEGEVLAAVGEVDLDGMWLQVERDGSECGT